MQGGSNGSRGAEPPNPPHFDHCYCVEDKRELLLYCYMHSLYMGASRANRVKYFDPVCMLIIIIIIFLVPKASPIPKARKKIS